jgi:hypothetical protein
MPESAAAGERRFVRTLVFKFAQVDSVLSADGRRPVRRRTVYSTEGEIMIKVAWNAFERIC